MTTYALGELREPTGWELDVTGDQVRKECFMGECLGLIASMDHDDLVDWFRTRIRPVYECKECAEWRERYVNMQVRASELVSASSAALRSLDAARAVLEGE